jgi:hypothetical protein
MSLRCCIIDPLIGNESYQRASITQSSLLVSASHPDDDHHRARATSTFSSTKLRSFPPTPAYHPRPQPSKFPWPCPALHPIQGPARMQVFLLTGQSANNVGPSTRPFAPFSVLDIIGLPIVGDREAWELRFFEWVWEFPFAVFRFVVLPCSLF